ncbi:endonuclease [Psychroflexus lacisalsi]|jgi:endonuclease I|uniref:Fibronectin type-III domain-containing protein n=1 Tax=Psychroflexus lacisalsi TaxID=503928 RepID=A0ABN1KCC1_9FLAO|nr:endonuclease [Psychroflexus lacisalsi]MBZ9620682.1 endonuclease [Psychroflexus lacisalsi]
MKQYIFPFFLFAFCFSYAQAPTGYYNSAEGLSGYQLKTALISIIDDIDDENGQSHHQDQGYNALFSAYASENSGDTDDYFENDGTVLDIYSEVANGSEAYNYEHVLNQCGNYNNEGDCYNREHLVPQSIFNSASPMRNDYFHVVPTDGAVNGARGNYPFGEVSNPNYISSNGSKRGENKFPGYSGTVFEPIDEFKGDIARSVLYFAIRYEDEFNNSWKTNEVLANNPQDFFVDWYIDLLLSWHVSDPVSQREIDRNNNGFQYQGNRNPLIDHPQFAYEIWGDPDNLPPTAPQNLQASNIKDSSINITWNPSQDNVGIEKYIVELDNINLVEVSSQTLNYTVQELSPERLYNFRVYAVDKSGNVSDPSENLEVVTLSESNILLKEDFENCNTVAGNLVSVSEVNDINWKCIDNYGEDNTQGYQMNAYQNNEQVLSRDWLITSDKIDFGNYEVEKISFWASASFGNTKLQLLYSSSYDGNGNPSNFDWQEIPNVDIPLHPDSSNNLFVYKANKIDISEISGEVYIAFKYDTATGENATKWTVDNFLIEGEQLLSNFTFRDKLEVLLYPNPSKNDKIHLDFNKGGVKTIEVYDLNGRLLLKRRTYLKNYAENLSQFQSGNYLMKIKHEGVSQIKRLVLK